jgi:hypothetical protein
MTRTAPCRTQIQIVRLKQLQSGLSIAFGTEDAENWKSVSSIWDIPSEGSQDHLKSLELQHNTLSCNDYNLPLRHALIQIARTFLDWREETPQ